MPYQWPQEPEDLFIERYVQMTRTGLPVGDVDRVRGLISDMWADSPGGWVYEWSQLGSRHASQGHHDLAALAFGWAKFPVLADDAKRAALGRQIDEYQLASAGFPVNFQRRTLELPHLGATTPVSVHILSPPSLPVDVPVLIASGGVDSWKMDLHALFVGIAQAVGVRVLAFDLPGTGESLVPMTPDGGTEIIEGLIAVARRIGNGKVGHLGISMGGHYSARTGLAGQVDAAIDLGGPVERSFNPGSKRYRFGMANIMGNALGFDHPPTAAELDDKMGPFSLRSLLDKDANAPMLVINGADDVHVPQHDTLVFRGRPDTQVELLADAGHCAVTKLGEVVHIMVDWLGHTLMN